MRNDDEYFSDEEFKEILNDYEDAVKSGRPAFMAADDMAEIAEYYLSEGRYDDAQQAIDRAAEADPHALAVLNYQIQEALHIGDIDAAQNYLDQIMERESPEYIYSQAEILISKDKIDEAEQYLREQLKDVPPDEYQDYILDVANIYTNYGLSDKAMEWMMRAKPENTDDFKELMARTLFGLGKYDDSERLFNELIDRDPFQKRYWNALASTQYMKANYSGSITSSEYAIAIDPNDPDALLAKANGLFHLGNYEEALLYYERYNELEPDDEYALLYQGTTLLSLGRNEEALVWLKKALHAAPDDSEYLAEIYEELAFAYSELGNPDEAIKCIDKTDELDCDHQDMLVIRGHILLANGCPLEAELMFKKALEETNSDPRIMLRIIVSLYDNQLVKEAYHLMKLYFASIDDNCTDGYAYMALCCYDLHKTDEFLKYLKIACERNPKETHDALSHLFPNNLNVSEYYSYIKEKLSN